MIQKNILSIKISFVLILLYCTLSCYQITYASSINPGRLGELLNNERRARGLTELTWNEDLSQAAEAKSIHMFANNYFNHYAPDGTTPWSFIKNTPYEYKIAGENLAMDFYTSEAVHDAWMASTTHRENMLNSGYKDYAISVREGKILGENTTLIVEMFGAKSNNNFTAKAYNVFNSVINYLLGKDTNLKK